MENKIVPIELCDFEQHLMSIAKGHLRIDTDMEFDFHDLLLSQVFEKFYGWGSLDDIEDIKNCTCMRLCELLEKCKPKFKLSDFLFNELPRGYHYSKILKEEGLQQTLYIKLMGEVRCLQVSDKGQTLINFVPVKELSIETM